MDEETLSNLEAADDNASNAERRLKDHNDKEFEDSSSVSNSSDGRRQIAVQDNDNPPSGAEQLVQNEARAVRFLRIFVIVVLVVASLLTGIFTYRLAIKNQIETFHRDFQALASRVIDQFEIGIGNYLYQSYTLSTVISGGIYAGNKPTFPEVTLAEFDNLGRALQFQAKALDVIWSPLLKTRSDRSGWEKYAARSLEQSDSVNAGQNQPCHICGEGNEVAFPNNPVVSPGLGTYSCKAVQEAGLAGYLSTSDCEASKEKLRSLCGCKMAITTTNATDQVATTRWNPSDGIFRLDQNGTAVRDRGPPPYSPVWQVAPNAAGLDAVLFNQMADPRRRKAINAMIQHNVPVFTEAFDPTTNDFYKLIKTRSSSNAIVGTLFFPVYESSESDAIAGSIAVDISWKFLIENGLANQSSGIVIVLENSCGQVFTFKVVGDQADLVGQGDLHDTSFDELLVKSSLADFLQLASLVSPRGAFQNISASWGCAYSVRIYPSTEMRARYLTSKPWVETSVVVSIFLFTSLVFFLYDFILRRLQAKVMKSAKRSEAIVSSMFPAVVRDRLYKDTTDPKHSSESAQETAAHGKQKGLGHNLLNHKIRLKTFLAQPIYDDVIKDSEPIADLFPNTTILFADIAGFTAWSSEREPAQVFKLLETIYGAFDQVANKRGVFKIETIGDCYVAVAGLPEPREDHAVVMVKFAFDCLIKMGDLTKKLESSLGPGTADLAIRVGLHSGPVTGGVLRGERARFQLFGDAMNTASRMESNGKVNHIHVSNETAQLLIKAGKSDWIEQRSETVSVKGKGEMQTYWVKPSKPRQRKASISEGTSSEDARSSSGNNAEHIWGATSLDATLSLTSTSNRRDRLIAWNTEIIESYLQKLVARRKATMKHRSGRRLQSFKLETRRQSETKKFVVDEITEIIRMPEFNEQIANDEMDSSLVDIGSKARSQLRDYVAHIAALYHDNAFHNFEHASHVVMSATKLLKRIIAPDDVDYRADETGKTLKSHTVLSKEIHDSTYGISSDPLMQFAVVFSALIHDVDHTGLQNRQLVKKNDPLAISYLSKCVAEQHSIQCAWHMLMEDRYAELRRCIYQTEEDRLRFRQLVINAVIATDIADKELQVWRQNRWDKAFNEHGDGTTMDRKATLLFEYILQASDVAPTMQHWHVYQKWNKRLFEERYIAYVLGNDEDDPSLAWYEGEMSFFDNYVIPLARNLEESHVFGVSCDDYLAYALENRREWETKGEQIVIDMVAAHKTLITYMDSENAGSNSMLLM